MKRKSILYIIPILLLILTPACRNGESHDDGHGHEHDHEHGHEVSDIAELSETQINTVGIKIGNVEKRAIAETITATGELTINPADEAVITPMIGGTVSKLNISPGQKISKGQVVAYIESPELMRLQQEYLLAVADENAAQQEVDRQNRLAESGAGIRKNLTEAQNRLQTARINKGSIAGQLSSYGISAGSVSEKPVTQFPVKAEIGGTVTRVMASIGSYADMSNPIAAIANNSSLNCTLQVFEKGLMKIKIGQGVDMRLTNNPDVEFTGRVIEINPVMDPETKTVPVIVKPENISTSLLVPGMSVTASLAVGDELGDAVPEDAVVSAGGHSYIFLLKEIEEENGQQMYRFEKREVVPGPVSLGYVSISPMKPLPENAQVVVANAFYLNSMTSEHAEHAH